MDGLRGLRLSIPDYFDLAHSVLASASRFLEAADSMVREPRIRNLNLHAEPKLQAADAMYSSGSSSNTLRQFCEQK